MKFEIDLNDILSDEYGAETIQESIKRQVIENLTKTVEKGLQKKINEEVSKIIQDGMADELKKIMPKLIDDLINSEFQPIDKWGTKSSVTTFRKELINSIHEQMTYKKENYSDRENVFTKAVNQVVSEEMKVIQANYKKQVDEVISKEAFNTAIKTLQTKLGLTQ